jgi:hypothetical protein
MFFPPPLANSERAFLSDRYLQLLKDRKIQGYLFQEKNYLENNGKKSNGDGANGTAAGS